MPILNFFLNSLNFKLLKKHGLYSGFQVSSCQCIVPLVSQCLNSEKLKPFSSIYNYNFMWTSKVFLFIKFKFKFKF